MTRSASLVALLLAAGTAAAQPAPSPNDAKADAALAEGRRLYDIADWDRAIAKFKEAYTLRPDPASLFNIAQSQRLKRDCPAALQSYKAYKRNYPDAKNLDKVDKFIIEMEACAATSPTPVPAKTDEPVTADPAKPVTPPVTAKHDRGWMKWAGIGAGVVGLGSAGLGIKFALDGRSFADDLKSTCAVSCTSEQALAIESDGESANTKAIIFSAVGGGLVIAGAVLIVLSSGGGSAEQPAVSVVPAEGGATAMISGTF